MQRIKRRLRTLTPKFNAFWNLKKDALYVEVLTGVGGPDYAMKTFADMRTRGLLDDFMHIAFDFEIWKASRPEHWQVLSANGASSHLGLTLKA